MYLSTDVYRVYHHAILYRIAGNFRWCIYSYIWPTELTPYARAARPYPCSSSTVKTACAAQQNDRSPGIWAFLTSDTIKGLMLIGLWVGRLSRLGRTLTKLQVHMATNIHRMLWVNRWHAEISNVEIFIVFTFAHRTFMWNIDTWHHTKTSRYTYLGN